MIKHTPGPWFVSTSDKGTLLIKPVPGQVVAECDPLPEAAANARLIAAAPQLLASLERLLSVVAAHDIDPHDEPILGQARAAITKATKGATA